MNKLKKATKRLEGLVKGYHGPSLTSQGIETALGAGPSMMAMSQTAKELQKRLLDGWHPSKQKKD